MSVAVVTPFFQTPTAWLQQCVDSVARQTLECTHFLVGDGDAPIGLELGPNVKVFRLPEPHADNGNAARAIGSVSAISKGFDAIAYLDADNWFEPEHVEKLWKAHEQTNAAICTSGRNLYDLQGQLLGPCPEVDGKTFVDTSCLFLTKRGFPLVSTWYLMPREHSPVCDRIFWAAVLKAKLPHTHVPDPTLAFRTNYAVHYRHFGKEPPPGAKDGIAVPVRTRRDTPRIVPSATKQMLSLCMIVKNEEANLAACLDSVADLADEIIVVDTGSTDRTVEIARDQHAKVVPFAWIDDFSAARNESLQHAGCDWVFWMDADDRLDATNRQKLQALKAQLPDGNVAYMMKQRSAPDNPFGSPLVVDHVRLFRKQPGVGWRYRLHEQILPSLKERKARVVVTDIVIDHLGYCDPALRRAKLQRNLEILRREHAEQPDDAFTLFNLGGTYLDMGEHEQAIPYLGACVEKAPRGASFLPKAYVMLVQNHRVAQRLDDAWTWCEQGTRQCPKSPELLFEHGLLCQARKDPIAAQRAFEAILTLPRGPQFVGTDEGIFGHLSRHHLAVALREQRQLLAAEEQWRQVTGEAPHFAPAWLSLAEVLLEQQRPRDAEALIPLARRSIQGATIAAVLAARLLLAKKQVADAVGTLETAVTATPDNQWLRLLLCDVMTRHGVDLDRVEQHLRQVLIIDPRQRQAKAKLAALAERKQQPAP